MQKRNNFFPYFFLFILVSLIIIILSSTEILRPITQLAQNALSPIGAFIYKTKIQITNIGFSQDKMSLINENFELKKKLIDQSKITADNKALRDQFQTSEINTQSLIPVKVIGAPGFIPGVSIPEEIVIDKGEKDGVNQGQAVIYKNNLIGKILKTNDHFATLTLVTNHNTSFTAKTLKSNSAGVVKGLGGGAMLLDNVLLSERIENNDLVITKDDVNDQGIGFPPGLIVGQIKSVNKNPSDLFQRAEVRSLVDFTKLELIFVVNNLQ